MRLTRVYVDVPLQAGSRIDLPPETAAHLVRVLRARSGDELRLFNGDGRDFSGVIGSVRGKQVAVDIGAAQVIDNESRLAVTLVQCVPRGEKMDLVVQKATELGVARIVPVLSERSVVRLDEAQAQAKQNHWQAVAASACEQCGRARLPRVERPLPLLAYLGQLTPAAHPRWVLDPHSASHRGEAALGAADMAIGPEGGFAQSELEAFGLAGYVPLALGPRVLRTETAAIAALVWLQTRFGDLS
jgi:16S rRNA (uracil1498-N3)-methyltransferase